MANPVSLDDLAAMDAPATSEPASAQPLSLDELSAIDAPRKASTAPGVLDLEPVPEVNAPRPDLAAAEEQDRKVTFPPKGYEIIPPEKYALDPNGGYESPVPVPETTTGVNTMAKARTAPEKETEEVDLFRGPEKDAGLFAGGAEGLAKIPPSMRKQFVTDQAFRATLAQSLDQQNELERIVGKAGAASGTGRLTLNLMGKQDALEAVRSGRYDPKSKMGQFIGNNIAPILADLPAWTLLGNMGIPGAPLSFPTVEAIGQVSDRLGGGVPIEPSAIVGAALMQVVLHHGPVPKFLTTPSGGAATRVGKVAGANVVKAAEVVPIHPVMSLLTGDIEGFNQAIEQAPDEFAKSAATFLSMSIIPLAKAGHAGRIESVLREGGVHQGDAARIANMAMRLYGQKNGVRMKFQGFDKAPDPSGLLQMTVDAMSNTASIRQFGRAFARKAYGLNQLPPASGSAPGKAGPTPDAGGQPGPALPPAGPGPVKKSPGGPEVDAVAFSPMKDKADKAMVEKWEKAGAPPGMAVELARAEASGDLARMDLLKAQFEASITRKAQAAGKVPRGTEPTKDAETATKPATALDVTAGQRPVSTPDAAKEAEAGPMASKLEPVSLEAKSGEPLVFTEGEAVTTPNGSEAVVVGQKKPGSPVDIKITKSAHEREPVGAEGVFNANALKKTASTREAPVSTKSVEAPAKPPELMTPDEFEADRAERAKAAGHDDRTGSWVAVGNERAPLRDALEANRPVNAALLDRYNASNDRPLILPDGYVREGDQYVFKKGAASEKEVPQGQATAQVDRPATPAPKPARPDAEAPPVVAGTPGASASTEPQPNESGVYVDGTPGIKKVEYKSKKAEASIRTIKVGGRWAVAGSYSHRAGNMQGMTEPLTAEDGYTYATEKEAISSRAVQLMRENQRVLQRKDSLLNDAQRAEARAIIAWAQKLIDPDAKLFGVALPSRRGSTIEESTISEALAEVERLTDLGEEGAYVYEYSNLPETKPLKPTAPKAAAIKAKVRAKKGKKDAADTPVRQQGADAQAPAGAPTGPVQDDSVRVSERGEPSGKASPEEDIANLSDDAFNALFDEAAAEVDAAPVKPEHQVKVAAKRKASPPKKTSVAPVNPVSHQTAMTIYDSQRRPQFKAYLGDMVTAYSGGKQYRGTLTGKRADHVNITLDDGRSVSIWQREIKTVFGQDKKNRRIGAEADAVAAVKTADDVVKEIGVAGAEDAIRALHAKFGGAGKASLKGQVPLLTRDQLFMVMPDGSVRIAPSRVGSVEVQHNGMFGEMETSKSIARGRYFVDTKEYMWSVLPEEGRDEAMYRAESAVLRLGGNVGRHKLWGKVVSAEVLAGKASLKAKNHGRLLFMVMVDGSVLVENEMAPDGVTSLIHDQVWGERAVDRSIARGRYRPDTGDIVWTYLPSEGEGESQESIDDMMFRAEDAMARRGATVNRHTRWGSVIRDREMAAGRASLKFGLGRKTTPLPVRQKSVIRPKPPGMPGPMLVIVHRDGTVDMAPEAGPDGKDRFHENIWGVDRAQAAAARLRYDPAMKTLMWTDRDDARDADVWFRVEDFISRRGGQVEKHTVLGGGRINAPEMEMAGRFSLKDTASPGALIYSEAAYAEVQPLLEQVYRAFQAEGKGAKEFLVAVIKSFGPSIRPFVDQFRKDLSAAKAPAKTGPAPAKGHVQEYRDLITMDRPQGAKTLMMKRMAEKAGISEKEMQERVEAELVRMYDEIARDPRLNIDEKMSEAIDLYEQQPAFNARTSGSMERQAYSTPGPLALLGSHILDLSKPGVTVYEATAGNGMLVIGADKANVIANEIDPVRATNLRELGIKTVTEKDATEYVPGQKIVDAVHVNPPFGPSDVVNYQGYAIKKLEHVIALKALEAMKDDGAAVMILGAGSALDSKAGQIGQGAEKIFFNYLYGHYNVVGNFEVSGDLYAKQGAGFPIRVVVVAGRRGTPEVAKLSPESVDRLEDWGQVITRAKEIRDAVARTRDGVATERAPGERPLRPAEGTEPAQGSERLPVPSGTDVQAPDRGGRTGGNRSGEQPATRQPSVGRPDRPAVGTPERPADAAPVADNGPGRKPVGGVEIAGSGGVVRGAGAEPGSPDTGRGTGTGDVPGLPRSVDAGEFNAEYKPRSKGRALGTRLPTNIKEAVEAALAKIESDVGDIDEYVRTQLGYETLEDMMWGSADHKEEKGLAGEQIDAVAMTIYQAERGGAVIVGDETGIGKGRVGAAMIRYAKRKGMIPVFFTKDAKLFSDMARDLRDTLTDINPVLLAGASDSDIVNDNDTVLFKAPRSKKERDALMKSILDAEGGPLKGMEKLGHDVIFAAYSQFRVENEQQYFLERIAAGTTPVFVIMDEAHEAAGGESMQGVFFKGGTIKRGKGANKKTITKSGILHMPAVRGALYLSATYAKRPDNMPVFFRTDLGKASDSMSDLIAAMTKGGVPLQQAVSEALAKRGQYVRRERDFTGVPYDMEVVKVANEEDLVKNVDAVTSVYREIIAFSERAKAAIFGMMGRSAGTAMSQTQIDYTEFAATVHNNIGQLLFAAKVDATVEQAIAAHKRGVKPVIAVMNTMEAFLDHYAEDHKIKDGDEVQIKFNDLLRHALSRTLRAREQTAQGDPTVITFSPADLGLEDAYNEILELIDEVEIALPVSPIDAIMQGTRAAGLRMGELTGRQSEIEYTNVAEGRGIYHRKKKASKNKLVNAYNSGNLDGLLINASGSTGLSIHASPSFPERPVKPRLMIIAQAANDINVFVQTLGRIKRTGMIPGGAAYLHEILPLEAERRPAALQAKKMKSLNANTTARADSAIKINAVDMLNKYGDQVIAEYLANDNPELARALGMESAFSVDENGEVKATEDLARKFTSRASLLPNSEQSGIYDTLIQRYNDHIEYLRDSDQYDLESVVHEDWDGVQKKSELLRKGTNEDSIFTASLKLETWDVKDNRPAPKSKDMAKAVKANLGTRDEFAAKIEDFDKRANEYMNRLVERYMEEETKYLAEHPDKKEAPARRKIEDVQRARAQLATKTLPLLEKLRSQIGIIIQVTNTETGDVAHGAIVNVNLPVERGGRFRLRPGAIIVELMVAKPGGKIKVSAAKLMGGSVTISPSTMSLEEIDAQGKGFRYDRQFIVGNPIRAITAGGGRGMITSFRTRDGKLITGLLMPMSWKTSDLAADPRTELISGKAVAGFLKTTTSEWSYGNDEYVISGPVHIVRERGTYYIKSPASRRGGGEVFLDRNLRRIVGEFVKRGNKMVASVPEDSLAKAADRIRELTKEPFRPFTRGEETLAQVEKANTTAAGRRGGKASLKEGDALPHALDRFFFKTPSTIEVPLSSVVPVRARPEGISNAKKNMRDAYNGDLARRQPLSLKDVGGGRYEIRDGNSTYAIAVESGWPTIYGRVLTDEQFAWEENAAAEQKIRKQKLNEALDDLRQQYPKSGVPKDTTVEQYQAKFGEAAVQRLHEDAKAVADARAVYQEEFRSKIKSAAWDLNATGLVGPVKKPDRMVAKTLSDRRPEEITKEYTHGFAVVDDVLRATLVIDREKDAGAMLAAISEEFGEPLKVRNWFEKPARGNYRGLRGVFDFHGFPVEIQITGRWMYHAKDPVGHTLFEYHRAGYHGLNKEMVRIYDLAHEMDQAHLLAQSSAMDRNSASSISAAMSSEALGSTSPKGLTTLPSGSSASGELLSSKNLVPAGNVAILAGEASFTDIDIPDSAEKSESEQAVLPGYENRGKADEYGQESTNLTGQEQGREGRDVPEAGSQWERRLSSLRARAGSPVHGHRETSEILSFLEVDAALGESEEFRAFRDEALSLGHDIIPIADNEILDGFFYGGTILVAPSGVHKLREVGLHEVFHSAAETAEGKALIELVNRRSRSFLAYRAALLQMHTNLRIGMGLSPAEARIDAIEHLTDDLVAEEIAADLFAGMRFKYGVTFNDVTGFKKAATERAIATLRASLTEKAAKSGSVTGPPGDGRFSMKDSPGSEFAELLQAMEAQRALMERATGTAQAVERKAGEEKAKKRVLRKIDEIRKRQAERLAAAQAKAGVTPPKTPPTTSAGIEAARQRVGEIVGERKGFVRAVEDVVNESFKLEAKTRGVKYYDWAVEAGNTLEQYLFEDAGARLTDDQRMANARVALIDIFGAERTAAIRRASRGNYLEAVKSVRAFMDKRVGRFYEKAFRRLVKVVKRDQLYPTEAAEFDALVSSVGDMKSLKGRPWHELKDLYEQGKAIKAESDLNQKQIADARREQRKVNAEVLLDEARAAGAELDKHETPQDRGFIRERMVDRQAAPDVLAATAFGGTKSHGANMLVYRPRAGEDRANALAERARSHFYDRLKALGIDEAEIAKERGSRQEYDFYGRPLRMSPSQRRMFYWTTLDADGKAKMIRNGFLVADLKGQPSKAVKGPPDDMKTGIDAMQVATLQKDQQAVEAAIEAIKMVAQETRMTLIQLKGIDPLRDRGGTYAPLSIETSGQQRNLEENAMKSFNTFLDKWGRFKDRVRHKNPLLIVDFYTAVEDQIDRLSRVAHMALPIRDAMQMLGHPEVGEAVRARMGSQFETKMRDVYRQASGFDPVFRSPPSALSPIARRAAAARLSALLTSILKNRYLGGGAAAMRIAMDNPEMARSFIRHAITPGTLITASGRADVALMMKDGYFANRWKHDLIRALTASPGKEVSGSTEFELMWDRELIRGLRPMARAEMANAVAMIRAGRAVGMSDAQAVEYAKRVTRETQNPSSAFDESDEYRKTRANPWKSIFFPFSGQRVVSRNLVHRALIDATFAKPGGKAKAWRNIGYAVGALILNLAGEYALMVLLSEIRNRDGGDDEERRQKRHLMALVSSLADLAYPMGGGLAVDAVASMISGNFRGASTLVGQLFESMVRGTHKAMTAEDESTRIKGIVEATTGGLTLAGAPYVAGIAQLVGLTFGPELRTEDSKKRGIIQSALDDLPDTPSFGQLNRALSASFAEARAEGVLPAETEEGNAIPADDQRVRFTQSFYAQVEKKYGEDFKKRYVRSRQE